MLTTMNYKKPFPMLLLQLAVILALQLSSIKDFYANPIVPVSNQTYAIIIGISSYKNVEGLQYAHEDAKSFAAFLASSAGGRVDPFNIRLFLNNEATAPAIGSAFEALNKKISPGDRVYFFFAGHGDIEVSNQSNGLLLLYNAPKSSYFSFGDDYLEITKLKELCVNFASKGAEVVIITDACSAGYLSGERQGLISTAYALSEIWSNEAKILSCQPDEFSQEGKQWGGGHGVFTHYLVDGLYGLADKGKKDGQISVLELESFLEENVIKDAAPAFQTPFAAGNKRLILSKVDSRELAILKTQRQKEIPQMSIINTKGTLDLLISGADSIVANLYFKYQIALDSGNLIVPAKSCAYDCYQQIIERLDDEHIEKTLQRNLAAALQDKAMELIEPILKIEKFKKKTIEEYYLAANELGIAIELLGSDHFLTEKLKARKLFLEAYSFCEEFDQLYADKSKRDTLLLQNASNLLYEAIAVDSNAAYLYFQLGWIFNTKGEFQKALSVYQHYVELVPNNKKAHNNLGYAYNRLQEYDKAIRCFERVVELDSNYAPSYNNIGMSYAYQEKFIEAIPYLKKAIEKDSMYSRAYYNLGLLNIKIQDFDKAKKYLNEFLNLKPTDFDGYYNLAAIASLENNSDEALKYLEKALDLGLDDEERILKDTDMDNIRNTKEFNSLMKKYFRK